MGELVSGLDFNIWPSITGSRLSDNRTAGVTATLSSMLPGVTMCDKDDENYVDSCVNQDTLATVIVDHAATA